MDYVKQEIQTKIYGLELEQHRAIREYVLGDETAKDRVRSIDEQINLLRGELNDQ